MTIYDETIYEQRYTLPMVFPRHEFARYYFTYEPGDHVVFGGPTQQSGKTQLAMDLLEYTATPECPAFVAVSKPKDPVTMHYARLYGWRIVRTWPPQKQLKELFGHKYSGYVIWPPFGDLHADAAGVADVHRSMIADRYGISAKSKKPKHCILVMDDTRDKEKNLGLKLEMTTVLTMAGAMGIGEWCFVQKPSQSGDTALQAYSAAMHWFLFKDATVNGREYYGNVAGVDPDYLAWVIQNLQPRQAVYVCRRGPTMCIVDSDSRVGKVGLT